VTKSLVVQESLAEYLLADKTRRADDAIARAKVGQPLSDNYKAFAEAGLIGGVALGNGVDEAAVRARAALAHLAARGVLQVRDPDASGYGRIARLFEKYADQDPDWADMELVWLAEATGINRIATLDVADFSAYRIHGRKPSSSSCCAERGSPGTHLVDTKEIAVAEIPQPRAKLFLHGRSQAVRLPKEFRFSGTEVYVRRQGDDVVLSSRPRASMQSLLDALGEFEPGFRLEREQPAVHDERDPIAPKRRAA
jgi:antitoxin VapB